MAALVTDFTREGIFEAIRARRTYALTGERIELDFAIEGTPMGSSIDAGRRAEVSFAVRGRDELDVVEVIQDGSVVHRAYAEDALAAGRAFTTPVQLRLEWGWGPWGALALDRVCDWAMRIEVQRGRIARFFPCLQSMPFDEQRRHRFQRDGESALAIRSYTARRGAYRENPNQSVVLEIDGAPDAVLELALTEPVAQRSARSLSELQESSAHFFAGPFPNEGFQWHRLVPRAASSLTGRCTLELPQGRSHAYLRARQKNGHMAWGSPVFLNWR